MSIPLFCFGEKKDEKLTMGLENSESFIQQYFPKMMAKASAWLTAEPPTTATATATANAGRVQTSEAPPPYSL